MGIIQDNEKFIKGKTAEGIIERLFIELGFEVYQFGIENIFPSLVHKIKKNKDGPSGMLRLMPDFVVYDPQKNTPHFIEVKFREKEELYPDVLEKLKKSPFKCAFVILVSKDRFMCLTIEEITRDKDQKKFEGNSDEILLRDRSEFGFDEQQKVLIDSFLQYPKLFFPSKAGS